MKRFWKEVSVEQADGGWRVLLDGRAIKTQGGAPQIVPTQALGTAMAEEWQRQGEEVDPRDFPLRGLADYAIDQVRSDRTGTIDAILPFAQTDTLCYRADPEEPLYRHQQEIWEPLVAACETGHGLKLERVSGIIHKPQSDAAMARFREVLEAQDDFALAALHTLASLAASLVVALALLDEDADVDSLFAAANAEEDWQAELWGWDHEAEKARDLKLKAFRTSAQFLELSRT